LRHLRFPLLIAVAAALVPAAAAQQPLVYRSGGLPAHGIRVTARSAILIDGSTGQALWGKRSQMRLPIASTTKIMTAVVAMERLAPDTVVTVPVAATRVEPSKEGLRAGEKVKAWKLFYGLLLYSGNDDAVALATAAGGTRSRFVSLMNEKARALGLLHTHFRGPSGLLDLDNYSTAWDLAALTRYALWQPRFRTIVRTRVKRVTGTKPIGWKIYVNHNKLLGTYPGADGVKTGWTTKAKHCLVASVHRNGMHLIAVVLGSDDAYTDVKKLFAFGLTTRV
jgi:serine-type D-Ala-D-Ala carboxypeptidase (penicillin-binding protein 5/6)